jgi:hypothetical protein
LAARGGRVGGWVGGGGGRTYLGNVLDLVELLLVKGTVTLNDARQVYQHRRYRGGVSDPHGRVPVVWRALASQSEHPSSRHQGGVCAPRKMRESCGSASA